MRGQNHYGAMRVHRHTIATAVAQVRGAQRDGATAKEAGPVVAESVDGLAALGKIHLQGLDRVQVELLTAGRAALAQLLHLLHELALVLGHTPERIFASKRALERMQTHTEHVEHTHTQS